MCVCVTWFGVEHLASSVWNQQSLFLPVFVVAAAAAAAAPGVAPAAPAAPAAAAAAAAP